MLLFFCLFSFFKLLLESLVAAESPSRRQLSNWVESQVFGRVFLLKIRTKQIPFDVCTAWDFRLTVSIIRLHELKNLEMRGKKTKCTQTEICFRQSCWNNLVHVYFSADLDSTKTLWCVRLLPHNEADRIFNGRANLWPARSTLFGWIIARWESYFWMKKIPSW